MTVTHCLLSSEIQFTPNHPQAPGGRKFVMTTKSHGWCRGRRTFRAPSNTSCSTPAPESRSETALLIGVCFFKQILNVSFHNMISTIPRLKCPLSLLNTSRINLWIVDYNKNTGHSRCL